MKRLLPPVADTLDKTLSGLAFAVSAFALGQFFDALRSGVVEELLGRFDAYKIEWFALMKMDSEELRKWDDNYFSYYVFDTNLAIGLLLLVIFLLIFVLRR